MLDPVPGYQEAEKLYELFLQPLFPIIIDPVKTVVPVEVCKSALF